MSVHRLRRAWSRISIRLLAFNLLLVFLPFAGASYLAIYESKMLQAQERSMVQQGRLLAAALSERGPLVTAEVEGILVRLEQRTTSRLRVVDASGQLLVDTSQLGPQREPDADAAGLEEQELANASRDSMLYQLGAASYRLVTDFIGEPAPPSGIDDYSKDRAFDGVEIRQALQGQYGAATRISRGGQRSVTLYSALPIRNRGNVIGVVLVSQSTFQILRALYDVRSSIFRFLVFAVIGAGVLSLLVSTTISKPLKRLRSQASAILDRRGRLIGRFGESRRLDEIGDLSRSLSELSERLEERMHFIESFAADVSHEFKNPLASIRSATETLIDIEDPKEKQRFSAMIQGDIARLENLLSGVREITLADAPIDEVRDKPEPVDLKVLLEGIAGRPRFTGGDVTIDMSLPTETVVVAGNGERLVRVFENLLDNAVGFSPAGGCVRVVLAAEGEDAVVRVEDEGPGVPVEHFDRVFDRFFTYRPNQNKKVSKDNSGLGLAIAKAIVERHRGEIGLRPSERGACFEVRLKTSTP